MTWTRALKYRVGPLAQRAVVRIHAAAGDPAARIILRHPTSDPYPMYERARRHGEVSRSSLGLHMVTSHRLANAVLRDDRFGVVMPVNGERPVVHPVEDSFVFMNPPDHTRLRRLVAPWFTARMRRDLTGTIESVVHGFLDELSGRPSFDLVGDFAVRVPVRVICEIVGLPSSDSGHLARWGNAMALTLDGIRTAGQRARLYATVAEMDAYFSDLIEHHRRHPSDTVLGVLVRKGEDSEPLIRRDVVATAGFLLLAGYETTISLIANGTLALLNHPAERAAFLADPGTAPAVVEEALRYDPPVQLTMRRTRAPVDLDGTHIPAGSRVMVLLAAANRDPALFDRPDRFDPRRPNSGEHLSFSSGVHYCLGAGLARIEAATALAALFQRFPRLRPAGPVVRRDSRTLRGVESLPVRTGTRP